MTSRVHVARALTPFKRLVQLIEDNNISAIPIVDDRGIPIGIVSESNLLFKERRLALDTGVVAAEIMTMPPITVRSDATLPQASRLMQEPNVRQLVAVDERGKIVGIVSRSDMLQGTLRTDDKRGRQLAVGGATGLL